MDETIACPGCQAQLTMPTLPAGQMVQCPRCRREFDPSARRDKPGVTIAGPPLLGTTQVHLGSKVSADEDEVFQPPRRPIMPAEHLIAPWFGYITMAVLAVLALTFLMRAYLEYEFNDPLRGGMRGNIPLIETCQMTAGWIALPCLAIWLFLASRNARLLHAGGFSMSPGWVLAIFCCPILNVIFLYLNLQELWRSSDARQIETMESWRYASPGLLIRLWGLDLLFVSLSSFCSGREGGILGPYAFCIINLNVALAGGLLIAIIYFIQARQHERYIRLYEDPD